MWGFSHIVIDGDTFRPAGDGEPGQAATVAPAFKAGRLCDLVAQPLQAGPPVTRLGVAAMLGAGFVESARNCGEPLLILPTLLQWLRWG